MIETLHISLNLKHKKVVIIGGGLIAERKLSQLLTTGADIAVIAPDILPTILAIPTIKKIVRPYQTGDLDAATLIYICTNDKTVNNQICNDARDTQLINDCSNRHNSTFYSESIIKLDDITVAISSNPTSPIKTKAFKEKLLTLKKNNQL